ANPERVLQAYDLVFAKGRSAIEALASGAAVILCDCAGVGPMVTMANVQQLRRLNFGLRALHERVSREAIAREIARYDPSDARQVTQEIRATAGASAAIDSLIGIYRAVIAEWAEGEGVRPTEDLRAASAYLQRLSPRLRWSEDPRAIRYLALRSFHERMRRVPGVAAVIRSPWAQQFVRRARDRWRAHASRSR